MPRSKSLAVNARFARAVVRRIALHDAGLERCHGELMTQLGNMQSLLERSLTSREQQMPIASAIADVPNAGKQHFLSMWRSRFGFMELIMTKPSASRLGKPEAEWQLTSNDDAVERVFEKGMRVYCIVTKKMRCPQGGDHLVQPVTEKSGVCCNQIWFTKCSHIKGEWIVSCANRTCPFQNAIKSTKGMDLVDLMI